MTEEMNVDRGQVEDAAAKLKGLTEAKLEAIFSQRKDALEMAGPPDYWDVYAIGPYQAAGLEPGRLIELGEEATILVVVWLNPNFPPPPAIDTCRTLTMHNDKVELFFYTANMQTMQPVPALTHRHCIQTVPGQCWYTYYWTFKPTEAACLYEMNICARVCNCANQQLPQYSAFVRWVEDLDYDYFFPQQGFVFDHPIRFMVSDPADKCQCD